MTQNRSATQPPVPIALVVGSWLSYSETFIYDQVLHQVKTRSRVLAIGGTKTTAERFPYEDVIALRLPEEVALRYAGVSRRFQRAIDEHQARLVHAHFGTNGALVQPLARRRSLPLAVTFHGHDGGGLLPRNRYSARYFRYQRLAGPMFEYGALFLCASDELAEMICAAGAPPERVVVHRLGIDTTRFAPVAMDQRAGRPTILSVGRLVEKKGIRYALDAVQRAAQRFPDLQYRIVGDGPEGPALRRQVAALGLERAVTFLGALPSDRVRGEMQRAHMMLTPSVTTAGGDRESGVLVLKEAGASGLPSVGTIHGGIPEIIDDGVTGYLVKERAVDALADSLTALLGDESLRAQMGAHAREKICREYDTKTQNRRLERHLLEIA